MYSHHIDDMVNRLRARGLITEDEKPEVKDALASYWKDKVAKVWMYDDILGVAKGMAVTLSDEELDTVADDILEVDASVGINWDTIEWTIDNIVRMRTE